MDSTYSSEGKIGGLEAFRSSPLKIWRNILKKPLIVLKHWLDVSGIVLDVLS
jgi:hypothetical protein